MWFWIIVGVLGVALLVGGWLWDRRWSLNRSRADEGYRPEGTTPYTLGDGGFTL